MPAADARRDAVLVGKARHGGERAESGPLQNDRLIAHDEGAVHGVGIN